MQPRSAPARTPKRGPEPRRKGRRALLWLAGAVTALTGASVVAGYFGIPWLIGRWLTHYGATPGSDYEIVMTDPLGLVTEIRSIEFRDPATGVTLAAERLVVDFAASSLLEFRPVVSHAGLERPVIRTGSIGSLLSAVRRAGSHVADLPVQIADIVATDGRLYVGVEGSAGAAGAGAAGAAEATEAPGAAEAPDAAEPIRFGLTLAELAAAPGESSRYALEATLPGNSRLTSTGAISPRLDLASGELSIDAIDLSAQTALIDGVGARAGLAGHALLSARFSLPGPSGSAAIDLQDVTLDLTGVSLTPATDLTVTLDDTGATGNLSIAATPGGNRVGGRLSIDDAVIRLRDERMSPPQDFAMSAASVLLTADGAGFGVLLGVSGRLDGAGEATATVHLPPPGSGVPNVSLEAAALTPATLAPYVAALLGSRLDTGTVDLGIEYALAGERVDGSLNIRGDGLVFAPLADTGTAADGGPDDGRQTDDSATASADGSPDDSPDDSTVTSLPIDLAVALLENADGILDIEIPFAGRTERVRNAAGAAIAARIATVANAPFDLIPGFGDDSAADAVPFLPGDAALSDPARATIARLGEALNARPRLGLRVHAGYEPTVDRLALARQQIRMHVQLATALPTGAPSTGNAALDFDSLRVRDVLDEFAGERLPAASLEALRARYDCEGAVAAVCERLYYEQLFDALVAGEDIAPTALTRLGRFRTRSVADALVALGIDAERIELATDSNEMIETPFGYALAVELTAADTDR